MIDYAIYENATQEELIAALNNAKQQFNESAELMKFLSNKISNKIKVECYTLEQVKNQVELQNNLSQTEKNQIKQEVYKECGISNV